MLDCFCVPGSHLLALRSGPAVLRSALQRPRPRRIAARGGAALSAIATWPALPCRAPAPLPPPVPRRRSPRERNGMDRPAPQAAFEGQNGSFHWVTEAKRTMTKITRIGIDLGKSTFHVCGVDRHGQVVAEKKFTRRGLERFTAEQPPCLVELEACGRAHHWARMLRKLGHDARVMSAQFVKPYVKRQAYQDTSLRYSKCKGFCPGSDANGNVPSSRSRATAADLSALADITHGAPLQA